MLSGVGDYRTFIGVSRPNLDLTRLYFSRECTDNYTGDLWGNGKSQAVPAGRYIKGDRVGVLLNLDDGSLRFFKNGAQHGPGFAAGSVTGPVVAAVQMRNENESMRLLPDTEVPAGY
jgi:hypothetical protein